MITFSCPSCTTTMQAENHFAGQTANCSRCHQAFVIPHPIAPLMPITPPPLNNRDGLHITLMILTAVISVLAAITSGNILTGLIVCSVMALLINVPIKVVDVVLQRRAGRQ